MTHPIEDPIRTGLARGWKVYGGSHLPLPARIECDVAIIGTGAGGAITAEILARAGLDVLLIEEGPLRSSSDFRQVEASAYTSLYQESAGRKTADKAINILQGRCVGGSTTVNWTSSFRTPASTLAHWQTHHGLPDYDEQTLSPYFAQVERRLNIGPWLTPPNENNDILRRGAARLGIPAAAIARNVRGCWNLGSCGMGCPTNAKQSMLVTSVPTALDHGARLLVQTRAERFGLAHGRATHLECRPVLDNGALNTAAAPVEVNARHFVLSAGAINSPAVLLRSHAPDPHGLLGQRTFLHPVVMSAAIMDQPVAGWQGAPQTVYTDHFLETQPVDGPIGFKLEAPPLHPVIFASTMAGIGRQQSDLLAQFPHTHVLLALMRDGFHPQSPGGRVTLRSDGSAVIDYPLSPFVMDGARRAFAAMAAIQFAAGARKVLPVHEAAQPSATVAQANAAIASLPIVPLQTRMVSAHVMGGCAMGTDESRGVVQADGTHWQIRNLSVHDGSVFPTSIGANPQLSVYGIANRMAQGLASRLGRGGVILA